MILNEQERTEFEKVARPLVEWLNKNCHPHVTVIVDPTSAELSEGCLRLPNQRLRARLMRSIGGRTHEGG